MDRLIELAKLCETLIRSQREELERHPVSMESTRQWCEGRESAWAGILDYCQREMDAEQEAHFQEWRERRNG